MARPRFTLERGGESIELAQGENLVGRGRSCAVVVIDPSVSRNHALVNVEGDRASVTDLGSANGTYVNGERVTTERYLVNGDQILFGETELEIRVTQVDGVPVDTSQMSIEESEPQIASPIDPRMFFCSECGADLDGSPGVCPECGHRVGDLSLSQSEAISLGEVLPVGELLATSAPDLLETGPRLMLPREADDQASDSDDREHGLELVPDHEDEGESTSESVAVESIAFTESPDVSEFSESAESAESAESVESIAAEDSEEFSSVISNDSNDSLGASGPEVGSDLDDLAGLDGLADLHDSEEFDDLEVLANPSIEDQTLGESGQAVDQSFASLDVQEFEPSRALGLAIADADDAEWLDETAAGSAPAALDAYPLGDSQTVGELMGLESSEESPGAQTVSDLLGSPPPAAAQVGEMVEESTTPMTPESESLPTVEETLPVTEKVSASSVTPLAVPPMPISGSGPRPASAAVDPYRIAVRSTPPGGFWRRLAAWIVDGLLFSGVGVAVSLAFGGPTEPLGLQAGGMVTSILSLLVPLIGWAGPGTTPGKRLFDLWVSSPDEEAGIGLGRALVRMIGFVVGAALFGIGFLMIPFNASKRGLHDLLAGTRVIVGRP